MMRFDHKLVLVMLTIFVTVGFVTAQDDCPAVVDDALFSLSEICMSIGRNQACYGNGDIVAIPQANATIDFDAPGDVSAVDDIGTLTLAPFEANFEEWGVAVLVLQATVPDTLPGQNVTMLLFGDSNLVNDGGAYYFTSGIGTPDCNQAPNGVLIQTPEGAGQITLTMNGIDISLGSTAYLSSLEDDELLIALMEGTAELITEEAVVELITEQFTTVLLDEDGNATGDFAEPASTDELDLPALPLAFLPDPVNTDDESDTTGETTSSDESSSISADGSILPLDGPWQANYEEFVFGDVCPEIFTQQISAQGLAQFGVVEGMTQELDFEDGDILGPLFLDQAEAIFVQSGFGIESSSPEPNVYTVVLNFEGQFVITYTWTVVSETQIDAQVLQEISVPGISCTVQFDADFTYAG